MRRPEGFRVQLMDGAVMFREGEPRRSPLHSAGELTPCGMIEHTHGETRFAREGVPPLGGPCIPASAADLTDAAASPVVLAREAPGSSTTAEGDRAMAGSIRLNRIIELLEQGQAVFSCGTPNGNFGRSRRWGSPPTI